MEISSSRPKSFLFRNLLIGIPLGLGLAYLLIRGLNAPPAAPTADELTQAAMRFGLEQIKSVAPEILLTPSFAKFPEDTVQGTRLNETQWRVSGQVDTQNALGAMLRRPWEMVVERNASTNSWTVLTSHYDGEQFYDRKLFSEISGN